jgi:DNA-binding transcriptional LysR family regulator
VGGVVHLRSFRSGARPHPGRLDRLRSNALDDALARLGLTRRVVASAPTEAAALEFSRGSDLLISVPEATTRSAVADLGLVVLPLPLELPPAPIYLSWHQRYDTDHAHAHAWLRGLARTTLGASRQADSVDRNMTDRWTST